jgi:hypothetical protein
MNYTKLFYWLAVADNAKNFFTAFIVIFTTISVISTIVYINTSVESPNEIQRMSRKWMWWSYPFMILFWGLYIFTPSKKDALLIVAGGQTLNFLTTDSSSKKIPHELSSFLLTEIKNMAESAEVDLNIASQKNKILQEAKNMTASELMEKMKADSNFTKIILR